MAEERPSPYIHRDPGDVIRSGDWNELQVQAREEVHNHRHCGGADGLKIPREGIKPNTIDGSLIDPGAKFVLDSLTVNSELKVNGKAILGDINDLLARFKGLETEKVNRAGDTINGPLTIKGNVGIGTSSPEARLEIGDNTSSASRNVLMLSADAPRLYFKTGTMHYNWKLSVQDGIDAGLEISSGNTGTNPVADAYTPRLNINANTGNVGIGTTTPQAPLEVNGSIHATPVLGSWYPSAHGPNASTPGGKQINIVFDGEVDVTDTAHFTNLGGDKGIKIEKDGYYHIEAVALVYVSPGDYGHLYLYVDGDNVDLDHSHNPSHTTWDDRHSSWKGFVKSGSVVRVTVYHHKPTNYWYHVGPTYTRLTIHKIN